MGTVIVFVLLAAIAIFAAVSMVFSRNAIYSALFLVLNLATIAVFYLVLNAPFIAMVQVAVYAGAIMVLFLFVIMLLGAERTREQVPQDWQRPVGIVLGVALAVVLIIALFTDPAASSTAAAIDSSPSAIGIALFEGYVFPFEVTSVLLLVAMIGVVVLKAGRRPD